MKRTGYAVVLSVVFFAVVGLVWFGSWGRSGGQGEGQGTVPQVACRPVGDVNNDRSLDISDAICILTRLFRDPQAPCFADEPPCIYCNPATGNVGIGTPDPRTPLHLVAPGSFTTPSLLIDSTGPSGSWISILKGTNSSLYLGHRGPWVGGGSTAEDLLLGANGSGLGIYFAVNGRAPTAVIDSSGNVGIGTTTPGHPLEMASGAHVTAGGVWTNSSSRELKEGIRDLGCQEACQALEELQPWKFRYKVDPADEHVGFIAEEVPELVATPDRKGLAPMDVVAVVVKVVQEQQRLVQEQQRLVQEQQRTIRALEDRLKALEARVK